jgi:hypothetical protein
MATDRFKDAVWLPVVESHYAVVGGAGGIGSSVAFLLARLNPYGIGIYDPENVDNVNLSNQLFSSKHRGMPKVNAVSATVSDYSSKSIIAIQLKFTEDCPTYDIYFACFDNMAARKAMFENFKRAFLLYTTQESNGTAAPLFIDGRLTAEQFQVYCVHNQDTIERYEKTLFPDEEAAILPCGFKGTTHNSFMIASKMIACYTNFAANIATGEPHRVLPFMIENDIYTMTETVEL